MLIFQGVDIGPPVIFCCLRKKINWTTISWFLWDVQFHWSTTILQPINCYLKMIVERHFYYVSFHLGPGITSAFCMVGNLTPSHQTSSIRLSEGNFCPNKHTLPPNEEMITNDSLFLVSFLNQWVKSRCPSAYNLCKYIIVHNIRT